MQKNIVSRNNNGIGLSVTAEPALKDQPICHKNVVSQDMWFLATDLVSNKM